MKLREIKRGLWALDVRYWLDRDEYRQRERFRGAKLAAEARFFEIRKELKAEAEAEHRSLTFSYFSVFGEVLDFFIEDNDLSKSRATCYFRRLHVGDNVLLNPPEEFQRWFDRFIELERKAPSIRFGKPLSRGAVNKLKLFAHAALEYALKRKRILLNPLAGIERVKEEPRRIVLSDKEIQQLISSALVVAPDIVPLVEYALAVPVRRGEMLRAERSCYNRFRNTILLPGHLTKNGESCEKPVPPHLSEYFKSIPDECPWLFYRCINGEFKPLGYIQKRWERIRKHANFTRKELKKLRFADLRHHAVTRLIDAGNPRQWVMSVAGWKNDMLAIYYNQRAEKIAQNVVFPVQPDTRPDTLSVTGDKTAEKEQILAVSA